MSTVLITGCSSGFGLETAHYFLERGWHVVATMRVPREAVLPQSERLRILPLDVTDAHSVRRAIESAGPIDALVNNAGIGLMSVFENTDMGTAREVFETNTFGTMAVTHAVLPQFREREAGVVVNVTSSVTSRPLPLLSIYTASKAAINAFTESLALELEQFNVRVRLVIPGSSPETAFRHTARLRMQRAAPTEQYADFAQAIFARIGQQSLFTTSRDVAEAIWYATTDPASPTRIPAGADAVALSA